MTNFLEPRAVEKLRATAVAHGIPFMPMTRAEWLADWEARWPGALLRNPTEPRLTCPWQLLEDIETWAVGRGWYRSGFGPNGHENGFNVFFKQSGAVSVPDQGLSWSQDEVNGDPDESGS